MMVPTIHLNGTSKQDLLADMLKAYHAIQHAKAALGQASPNGRDYYPQGNGALLIAQDEHRDRIDRLTSVADEIEALAMAIQDGGHKS